MKIQRGDVVYGRGGKPGVVTGRDDTTGRLDVVTEGKTYENVRKHGFINGIPEAKRQEFTKIMESVREIEDPQGRIAKLAEHIYELEQDPKNFQLAKYLKSEQAHLTYMTGVTQTAYIVDENKLYGV